MKDHVWISQELAAKLTSVHVCPSYFPDHAVVYGKFDNFGPNVTVWYKPHPIPWEGIPVDYHLPESTHSAHTAQEIFARLEVEVDAALIANQQPPLLQCQKGRAVPQTPRRLRHGITPLRPSRKGEEQVTFLGESYQHVQ